MKMYILGSLHYSEQYVWVHNDGDCFFVCRCMLIVCVCVCVCNYTASVQCERICHLHHRLWFSAIIRLDDAITACEWRRCGTMLNRLCAGVPLQGWHHSTAALSTHSHTLYRTNTHARTHSEVSFTTAQFPAPSLLNLSLCGQQQLVCVSVCEEFR